jgi:hypothetical protein
LIFFSLAFHMLDLTQNAREGSILLEI